MSSRTDRANAVRALSMDAVQRANSGHPGAPMGLADVAEILWREVLKHNPRDPGWCDRDRVVLSNGHGSMLLYSVLHLSGYDVSIDDIKAFRQLHSKTAGHPEYGECPGVETTTGPLGQGMANAVGMALAEERLAAEFNRPGHEVVNHRTWVIVGDGCLMEGISHEAASLAGTLKLGKLVCLYDDNGVSIDGAVGAWFTEDVPGRFRSYGWRVIEDLNVRGMAANRRLALSVMDGGFHEFRRQLAYKAAMVGSTVVLADRWYPSSKTCSCCGSVAPGLDLSQRIYRCGSCGLEIDRDLNAARNLEGMAASSAATACGGTRSGAPATRPRVGTGRVKRVPSKQEPDSNAPASGRGQPAQLYAEAGRCA